MALKTWLIDTGPFVAYVDARDSAHDTVAARLDAFTGELITTGAVITEVMYFVSDVPEGPGTFAQLLLAARVRVVDATQPADVAAAAALMQKYRDTPMDFADATLVLAADVLKVTEIATLDRRGFSTYRTPKGRRFRLVLGVG